MNKCDKCGCEHNSTSACPRCGAPVVMVNQDYLLRRKEWEEKQKEYLRTGKPQDDSSSAIASRKGKVSRHHSDSDEIMDLDEKDELPSGVTISERLSFKDKLIKHLRAFYLKEFIGTLAKIIAARKIKNANKNKILKSREKKRNTIIALIFIALAIFVTVGIIRMDHSKLVYYDGHEVMINNKLLFSTDEYSTKANAILAYSSNMGTYLIGDGGKYYIRTEKTAFDLSEYENEGATHTDQYGFSDNGRFFGWVNLEDDGEYSVNLFDIKKNEKVSYTYNKMIKIVGVTDSGVVIYSAMNVMEDAIVVDTEIYTANMLGSSFIDENVSHITYQPDSRRILYMVGDSLYLCDIKNSAKKNAAYKDEISLVAEEIEDIIVNKLGDDIMYRNGKGVFVYEDNNSILVSSNIDSTDTVYYSSGKYLYYLDINNVYHDVDGQKTKLATKKSQSDVVVFDETMYFVDETNKMWSLNKKATATEGITDVASITGNNGYTYTSADGQYVVLSNKKYKLATVPGYEQCYEVIVTSGKTYYVDSSSVLYLDGKEKRESLGYAAFVGRK